MKSFRQKLTAAWTRTKKWFFGLLVTLGLVTMAVAQAKTMSWTHPTERVDGSPLAVTEIAETRIYCDGEAAIVVAAPASSYQYLTPGTHTCHATTVDTQGLESDPSNTITFEVLKAAPAAPVLSVQ